MGGHDCDAQTEACSNTLGAWECSCAPGWELGADDVTCVDIDECTVGGHDCDAGGHGTCGNTAGGWICGCVAGFELASSVSTTCVDTDECDQGTHDCLAPNFACANTEGSFECVCAGGWADADCGTCVRYAGDPGGDGLTWTSTAGLRVAVDAAEDAIGQDGVSVCEVWALQGAHDLYTEATSNWGAKATGAVHIYGGFTGSEGFRDERSTEPALTVLDCSDGLEGHLTRCIHLQSGAQLDGVTVTGASGTQTGAGVYVDNGTATITNCIVTGNTGSKGGGIGVNGAALVLSDSWVLSNVATSEGGGLHMGGGQGLTVSDTVIADNTSSGKGAGARFQSSAGGLFERVTFEGNVSDGSSGGVHVEWSTAPFVFRDSRFIGNRASSLGGALYITNDNDNTQAEHEIEGCIFVGNAASSGGALMLWDSGLAVPITNCTFAGNAAGNGGAIEWHYAKQTRLRNSIAWGNHAADGPDLRIQDGATLTVSYSLVAGGWAGDGNVDGDPGFTRMPLGAERLEQETETSSMVVYDSTDYSLGDVIELNLDGVARTVLSASAAGEPLVHVVDFSPALSANQPAGSLVWNWGGGASNLDWDVTLTGGSPAIDAGDGGVAPAEDIDGNPRVDDSSTPNTGVDTSGNDEPVYTDLGALEYQPVPE